MCNLPFNLEICDCQEEEYPQGEKEQCVFCGPVAQSVCAH